MPSYIEYCLMTWKQEHVMITFDNLWEYTDLPINKLSRFSLPQIADIVRVHVLRDNGGYWFDADTIMLTDNLPTVNLMGYPRLQGGTIGMLYVKDIHSDMFEFWASEQDRVINDLSVPNTWDMVGNALIDDYVKNHSDIQIGDVTPCWAETYMISEDIPRRDKYNQFYWDEKYHLCDIEPTDMLMLHNSWTPQWYKELSTEDVLCCDCTMSNILREVLS